MNEPQCRFQTRVDGVLDGFLDLRGCLFGCEGLGCLDEDVTKIVQPERVHLFGCIVECSSFEILVDLGRRLAQLVQDPSLREGFLACFLLIKRNEKNPV